MDQRFEVVVNAWMTDSFGQYSDVSTPEGAVDVLAFMRCERDMSTVGWTLFGTAHVAIERRSDADLLDGQIKALRAQQQTIRAEAENKATEIERRIQTLLAIEGPKS